MRFRFVALWLALSFVPVADARADARGECVATLDDVARDAALARVRRASARAERRARRWFFVWVALNGGLAVGSTVYAATADDRLNRAAGIWSAAGSTLTLGLMFAPPVGSAFASRRFARSGLAGGDDASAELAFRLAALEDAAAEEQALRSPWMHVASGAFSLAEGLHLGLAYDHAAVTAWLNGLGTFVFAEAQTLSAPREAWRAHRRWREEGLPCAAIDARARRPELRIAATGLLLRF